MSLLNKKRKKFNCLYLVLLIPITALITYLSTLSPIMVERVYSRTIYRVISQVLSSITGIFPFSLGELIVVSTLLSIIIAIVFAIIKIIKTPRSRLRVMLKQLSLLTIGLSLVYFSFITVWGLNYHRLPFATIANLDVVPTSVEELEKLCKYLINKANYLRNFVEEDSNGVMHLPKGVQDALRRADQGYQAAASLYPELGGRYGRPKGVILSKVMSYGGIWGVYFPFTFEANVNISIPHSVIPSTTTHEMAHQRGFAREDEANFIAYVAASMHPDYDFQYSGTLLSVIHSMNALAKQDFDRFRVLSEEYSPGLVRDLKAISDHSQKYEGVVSKVSNNINDAYLRVNAQNDGVQSYGRMVDLLLAHYRESLDK